MNELTVQLIRRAKRMRDKGKSTFGYVFRQYGDEKVQDELEELGFYLDRFDMFVTDIFWEDVDFEKLKHV